MSIMPLNPQATEIFNSIMTLLGNKSAIKIDNSLSYMPLNVDRLSGKRVAFAHNSIQDGDVMADPDMEFFIDESGNIFPCTFQNSYIGLYHVAIECEGGKPARIRPRLYESILSFANTWLINIKDQQRL